LVGGSAVELDIHDKRRFFHWERFDNQWTHGVLSDVMVQYWYLIGDTSNNTSVRERLYDRRGRDNNFMPTSYMGNHDQALWGLAAMTAAKLEFPRLHRCPRGLPCPTAYFMG
jgi:hypothetical protein